MLNGSTLSVNYNKVQYTKTPSYVIIIFVSFKMHDRSMYRSFIRVASTGRDASVPQSQYRQCAALFLTSIIERPELMPRRIEDPLKTNRTEYCHSLKNSLSLSLTLGFRFEFVNYNVSCVVCFTSDWGINRFSKCGCFFSWFSICINYFITI